MLSRKYYQLLSNTIKNSENLEEFTSKLCYELKCDNYNFNENRFLKACKGE